jgi:hypothetical protein
MRSSALSRYKHEENSMNRFLKSVVIAGSFVCASGIALAQNVRVDPNQAQLLLAASSTDTLGKELDQAGALGFRILLGTTRGNGEVVLLLERNPKATQPVQHKIIATNATGTFKKEIGEWASQGFRAVPTTFLNKPTGFNEIMVVMERPAKPARYEYDLLSTNQTSTLESEWVVALSRGYRAIGLITRAEVMLLVERQVGK